MLILEEDGISWPLSVCSFPISCRLSLDVTKKGAVCSYTADNDYNNKQKTIGMLSSFTAAEELTNRDRG